MDSFIIDQFPVLSLRRSVALDVVQRVAALYPSEVTCSDKRLGPDEYMCRSLAPVSRQVREDFEALEWGENLEFAAIAMDFVGLALKAASKYQLIVHPANLDHAMILANIEAREDIAILD